MDWKGGNEVSKSYKKFKGITTITSLITAITLLGTGYAYWTKATPISVQADTGCIAATATQTTNERFIICANTGCATTNYYDTGESRYIYHNKVDKVIEVEDQGTVPIKIQGIKIIKFTFDRPLWELRTEGNSGAGTTPEVLPDPNGYEDADATWSVVKQELTTTSGKGKDKEVIEPSEDQIRAEIFRRGGTKYKYLGKTTETINTLDLVGKAGSSLTLEDINVKFTQTTNGTLSIEYNPKAEDNFRDKIRKILRESTGYDSGYDGKEMALIDASSYGYVTFQITYTQFNEAGWTKTMDLAPIQIEWCRNYWQKNSYNTNDATINKSTYSTASYPNGGWPKGINVPDYWKNIPPDRLDTF